MNYIAEINGFERWLETHPLPTLAQLLWYKLLYWSSRSGWPEWTQVDNRRLMVSLQIAREASLTESRERLVNAGLIEYQKGRKGIPGRYRMISFSENPTEYPYNMKVQTEAQSVVYPVCNPVVYSEVQTVDIINNKQKQKQEKSNTDVLPEKSDAFSDQIATIREFYNSVCGSYPRLTKLSEANKRSLRARLRSGYTVEDFKRMFELAEASDFLKGKNDRNWSATFDWMIADANMAKILKGNYRNPARKQTQKTERPKNRFNNFDGRGYDYDRAIWEDIRNRRKEQEGGKDDGRGKDPARPGDGSRD